MYGVCGVYVVCAVRDACGVYRPVTRFEVSVSISVPIAIPVHILSCINRCAVQ